MSKRKATNGNENGHLTPQHLAAVDLLAGGRTLTETAEALGVGRPAVSDWCNHFPAFQAALNARRQELWESQVATLRGLVPRALEVLQQAMDSETPLQAAVHVLRAAGLYGVLPAPNGPTTLEAAEQAQRQREVERTRTALTAEDVALAAQQRENDRVFTRLTMLS